jgi:hypothetical protein
MAQLLGSDLGSSPIQKPLVPGSENIAAPNPMVYQCLSSSKLRNRPTGVSPIGQKLTNSIGSATITIILAEKSTL